MALNDLFDYMRIATQQMQSEYWRIQKRAVEDPGTAGDNGEENWAELLRQWLPKSYQVVTKGRIMSANGECSPQVDVLVLSPSYPEALLGRKEYLEGGVVAAFECKLTLKGEHVRDVLKNAAAIHRISKSQRKGTPRRELYSRIFYGLLTHSHAWQGEKSTPIENVFTHLDQSEIEILHPVEMPELICISDLATWKTTKVIICRDQDDYLKSFGEIQKADGVVSAGHVCFAGLYQLEKKEKQLFTPIGVFLSMLLRGLAWEDPSLRPLVEYFNIVQLVGSGSGRSKHWPLSILSPEVAEELRQGRHITSSDDMWDEWHTIY